MLLLKYLSDDVGMLMDMGAFDQADDTVLMWHCGPAASGSAGRTGYRLSVNYHGMAHEEGAKEPNCCGVTRDMVFDPGEVTIARISGEADELLVANGSFLGDTKPSFYGLARLAGRALPQRDPHRRARPGQHAAGAAVLPPFPDRAGRLFKGAARGDGLARHEEDRAGPLRGLLTGPQLVIRRRKTPEIHRNERIWR